MRTGSIIALAALICVAFLGPLHSSAGGNEGSALVASQPDSASANAAIEKSPTLKPAAQRHAVLSSRFEPLLLLLLGSVLLAVGTSVRVAGAREQRQKLSAISAPEKESLPF